MDFQIWEFIPAGAPRGYTTFPRCSRVLPSCSYVSEPRYGIWVAPRRLAVGRIDSVRRMIAREEKSMTFAADQRSLPNPRLGTSDFPPIFSAGFLVSSGSDGCLLRVVPHA